MFFSTLKSISVHSEIHLVCVYLNGIMLCPYTVCMCHVCNVTYVWYIYIHALIYSINIYMAGSALDAGEDRCPTITWWVPCARHCVRHNLIFTVLRARYCFIPTLWMRKLRHRLVKKTCPRAHIYLEVGPAFKSQQISFKVNILRLYALLLWTVTAMKVFWFSFQ